MNTLLDMSKDDDSCTKCGKFHIPASSECLVGGGVMKYIVYYFAFKEGNEGKTASAYPMLHDTMEEVESTKRFLTFHGAAIDHIEHREPTAQEIIADVPFAAVRAISQAEEAQ